MLNGPSVSEPPLSKEPTSGPRSGSTDLVSQLTDGTQAADTSGIASPEIPQSPHDPPGSLQPGESDDDYDELDLLGPSSLPRILSRGLSDAISTSRRQTSEVKDDHKVEGAIDEVGVARKETEALAEDTAISSREAQGLDSSFNMRDPIKVSPAGDDMMVEELEVAPDEPPQLPMSTEGDKSQVEGAGIVGEEVAITGPVAAVQDERQAMIVDGGHKCKEPGRDTEPYPRGGDSPTTYIPYTHPTPPPILPNPPRQPFIIIAPVSPISNEPSFVFEPSPFAFVPPETPQSPAQYQHRFNPNYTLPSLKSLPVEFNRKSKPTKQQRKREKEREKNEGRKEKDGKDDWFPMGLNRWAVTINANPVWKKVSRASKCLSTREWAVRCSVKPTPF